MRKFLILFLLFGTSGLQSQALEEEPVATDFSVLSWGGTVRGLFFWNGEERVDITVHNGAPSPKQTAELTGTLSFYRDGPMNEEGERPAILVGSVPLVPGTRDNLVIFMPLRPDSSLYPLVPVRTGMVPNGRDVYKVFNMADSKLVAQIGKTRLSLEPKQSEIMDAPSPDRPNFRVAFALQVEEEAAGEEEWKLVYQTEWVFRKGRSSLVFVLSDPRREGMVTVRRVYLPTEKQQPETVVGSR
tara:strand:+ start:3049 stop:3777 length:729 start_codon:yes stop_codon:yes gene_type:complete